MLDEVPADGDHAGVRVGDLLECTWRKIDRIGVCAGRAVIYQYDSHRLAVIRVRDVHTTATERGPFRGDSVTVLVNGTDHLVVGVETATCTLAAVLFVKGSKATSLNVGVA